MRVIVLWCGVLLFAVSSVGQQETSLYHAVTSQSAQYPINRMRCVASFAVTPENDVIVPACLIVATVPFTFTLQDNLEEGQMLDGNTNGLREMTIEIEGSGSQSTKDLIAIFAKAFRDVRKSFCSRHPSWFVFNINTVLDGPEFSTTGPESCHQ